MTPIRTVLTRPIEFDSVRVRLWIMGQRCHHGATGMMLATTALIGARAGRIALREGAALAGAGTLLMAHDWKDRSMWFERGRGTQP
jgi:hypothetical protein